MKRKYMGMVLCKAILGVMMTITAGAAGTETEFGLPEEMLLELLNGSSRKLFPGYTRI